MKDCISELSIEELNNAAIELREELDEEREILCSDVYEEKHRTLEQIEAELEER